jgi:protein gp37
VSAVTKIEWCTRSWNAIRGCSRVSPGCDNCYAMKFAHRFAGAGKPYEGLTTIRRGKVDWTGTARLIPGEIDAPLRWRRTERVFVNSMSDLFHHSLSFEQIDRVYGTMWACRHLGRDAVPGHEFLVLTKRPDRMREYLSQDRRAAWAHAAVHVGGGIDPDGLHDSIRFAEGPHPRIWHGVSVENQETANERLPLLLACPSAVRFVSYEPALGPARLSDISDGSGAVLKPLVGLRWVPTSLGMELSPKSKGPTIDWVIVGGESGPGARPFAVEWAQQTVADCGAAGTACFVKQLGAKPTLGGEPLRLQNRKGADMSEWPVDLRIRQFPEVRVKAKQKAETQLQARIVSALEKIGVWVIRQGVVVPRAGLQVPSAGEPGQPDLWTNLGWIEVKLPGEDLDPDQVKWFAKAKLFGVRTAVAHSVREACSVANDWRREGRAA